MRTRFIVLSNLKRRKKYTLSSIFILFLAQLCLLGSFTYSHSTTIYLDKYIFQALPYRTLSLNTFVDDPTVKPRIDAVVKNDPRIVDCFHQNYGSVGFLDPSSIPELPSQYDDTKGLMHVYSYRKAYDKQIIAGRKFEEGETHVGLVPDTYLPADTFSFDFWGKGDTYIDGSSLIGQELTLHYYAKDYSKDSDEVIKTFDYTFEVVGTYDLLMEFYTPNSIIIPYEDMEEMQGNMDRYDIGLTKDYNRTYNIEVDTFENVQSVQNELVEAGFDSSTVATMGPTEKISQIILKMGTIVAGIIFLIGGLLIGVSVYKSIHDRRQELGMLQVVGYTQGQLVRIILYENLLIGAISFISIGIVSAIVILGGNALIVNKAALISNRYRIIMPYGVVLINIAISFIIPALASVIASLEIRKVQPIDALYKRKKG